MDATTVTVTSVTKDSPGAGQVTIVATYATASYTLPSQQVTVGEFPSGNSAWSRALRLTNEAFFCMRNSVTSVAITVTSLSKIACALVNALTWAPKITTQPVADSCVASSTSADFVVVVASELALTYAWKESADGVTYGSALTTTGIYNVSVAGTLTITPTNTSKNGYRYRCTVTNGAGSTDTDAAVLTVT